MDARLLTALEANPALLEAVEAAHDLSLPDAWVAAGCVAQTVWNLAAGRAPLDGVRDLDLIYFDPDLSERGERLAEGRVAARLRHLPVAVDVKNEARVHLWYRRAFGYDIAPYASIEHAVSTFPTTATAVAVRRGVGGWEARAPFGLDDLFGLVVRPNRRQVTRAIYEAKAARWRAAWPFLRVLPWGDDSR